MLSSGLRRARAAGSRTGSRSQLRASVSTPATVSSSLLDRYWLAQGVIDDYARTRLVEIAGSGDSGAVDSQTLLTTALPGLPAHWGVQYGGASTAGEVQEVSRRLVQLQQLLGEAVGDEQLVFAVQRAPGLLSASLPQLQRRLLELRLAADAVGSGIDVCALSVRQPSLLLADATSAVDLNKLLLQAASAADQPSTTSSTSGSQSSQGGATQAGQAAGAALQGEQQGGGQGENSGSGGRLAALMRAWEHGLLDDDEPEWQSRFEQLQEYVHTWGDPHVGTRSADDPELSRWAQKQRAEHRAGELAIDRAGRLGNLGFVWEAERAEWLRWYKELATFKAQTGHASPAPLGAEADLYLINWCSIQRIARRSRVLPEDRIALLDQLGFDWSGADPLS